MNIKMRLFAAGLVASTVLGTSFAAYAVEAADDTIKPRVEAIEAEYAPQFTKLQQDGAALGDYNPGDVGAVVGIGVKVSSHREDIYVKIPEFWMGFQRIVVTVPEVTMRQQRWVFHTPSVRMKRVQVGVHPEWFGPFRMEWKPNYMDVPEPFMQRQEVILGVPEFKMGNQEIKLHLPQVAMREQHWALDIPDVTVTDVHAEIGKRRSAADELQKRGHGLAKEMKLKINHVLLEELPKKRQQLAAAFDDGEKRIKDAIIEARKYNVDTSKSFADGQPGLDEVLTSLQRERATALRQLDDQIEKVKQSEA